MELVHFIIGIMLGIFTGAVVAIAGYGVGLAVLAGAIVTVLAWLGIWIIISDVGGNIDLW
jgi:hypothetical protein